MGMETHGITNTFALLGKALTGTEEGGYQIARHLTDYVLFWGGGGGDDLAKSPHLARIANSVYPGRCHVSCFWISRKFHLLTAIPHFCFEL